MSMISEDIMGFFTGKRCLVTGGTGMIGRFVVDKLVSYGADVTSISLDNIQPNSSVKYLNADLSDFGLCLEITKDMDCVFHVAGVKGSVEVTKSKPASFLVPLLQMNTNIIEASRQSGIQHFVYTSTIGTYPSAEVFVEEEYDPSSQPMDHYPGWAKRMAEMQIETYNVQYGLTNYGIVRPCNVYGPGDSFKPESAMVIPTLLMRIINKENPVMVWGDGRAIRDFAYAEDVAEGIILALYHGTQGSFVNLGSGTGVTIKELLDTIQLVTDFTYEFDLDKPSGFKRRIMNIDRAKDWIGYSPQFSLEDGLRKTWSWLNENVTEHKHRKNYFN